MKQNILPAFRSNNIPIVFSSDNNYAPYLGVAIKSIIENSSKDNNYDVLILDGDISENNKTKMTSMIENNKNFSIRFIEVDNLIKNNKVFYTSGYFTKAAYYRLFVENFCKNYKKIIYLDCDVIAVNDVAKLFKIKLGEKLIGAVITCGISKDTNFSEYISNTLNIPDQSKYFNSGVLLININKVAKYNLLKKSLSTLKKVKKPIFVDQCILNSVLFGKVKFIDKKFNHFAGFINNSKNKVIIHYNGEKPWNNTNKPLSEYFWRYALKTPFLNDIVIKNLHKLHHQQNSITDLLNYKKITTNQVKDYLKYKKTRKAKVVIYTSYTNNFDKLINHTYISKEFDYICFTDKPVKNLGIWEIIIIKDNNLDSNRKAKEYKIFPNKYFSKYNHSVWVDTSINITSNIFEDRINHLINNKKTLAIQPHNERNCIYQEAKTCIDLQKDDPEIILKTVDFIKKEKYPKNNGLFENGIIFREHNNPKIIKLMEDWWWMISNFSRRDQLSFNYVLWKNNLKCTPLFNRNIRLMTNDFVYNDHNIKIVSTIFIDSGKGFNENEFFQKLVVVSNNKYKLSFKLNENKIVKQIKLNPLVNQYCQFKISKIVIDKKIKSISKLDLKSNGSSLIDGLIDFSKTSSPKIIFKISKKFKKISIIGNIYFYKLENLYKESVKQINDLLQINTKLEIANKINVQNQRIREIEQELKKIRSSKAFKIWRLYCKIIGK